MIRVMNQTEDELIDGEIKIQKKRSHEVIFGKWTEVFSHSKPKVVSKAVRGRDMFRKTVGHRTKQVIFWRSRLVVRSKPTLQSSAQIDHLLLIENHVRVT